MGNETVEGMREMLAIVKKLYIKHGNNLTLNDICDLEKIVIMREVVNRESRAAVL